MKYILSFGGGLNSTALLVYLIKNKKPLDSIIFADTGNEFDYTYENVKFYQNYAKSFNIEFSIVTNTKYNKDLYTYCWDKKIIPSRMRRDCTTKFKVSPIRRFIKNKFGKKETFVFYIGISLEESHRMRDSDVKYIKNEYPLIDEKIDREGCKKLLEKENLPIPDKSGCFFCPFTKKQNWIDMSINKPQLFKKSILLEQNSSRYPSSTGLLSSKPLSLLNPNTKLEDFEHTCDISGSCFL